MSKITAYGSLATTQPDDVLPVVDVHDTTMAPSGTTKKVTVSALLATEQARALAAEALLAPLASPALTGSPTAPTQTTGDSSTKLATDAFVATAAAASTAYFLRVFAV